MKRKKGISNHQGDSENRPPKRLREGNLIYCCFFDNYVLLKGCV